MLSTALRLAALCCALTLVHAQPAFQAGAAKRIITPDPLLPISGGMGIPTQATSRQGELTVRVLAFRTPTETVAVVGLDLLGFPSVLGDPRACPGPPSGARQDPHRGNPHPQRAGLLRLP